MNAINTTDDGHLTVPTTNPYDFLNPVQSRASFAGRAAELQDIRYSLNQARPDHTSMHVAIIGPRASGKTSLLHMVGVAADDKGFCPVQIYLTEADAHSELFFFHRVFENLLFEACRRGAFGGLTGKTYLVYRDIVDSYEIPEDKTFCPFLFPIQYANAMRLGNSAALVSDLAITHDFELVANSLNTVIVLCLDECDVLSYSLPLLQRIRGILQRIKGVLFIFSGTPLMFPAIEDVFSPLARQFKKIRIGPFADPREIRDCIFNPLLAAGVESPQLLFDYETYRELTEMRGVTGGNPYELQLVCHYLYRQWESGETSKFILTLEVLESVLNELEHGQDIATRRIVQDLRTWDTAQLAVLGILCSCSGSATLEQLIWYFSVFREHSKGLVEDLSDSLTWMVERGVIALDDGVIRFAGDEFDRLYSKYLAKQQNVTAYVNSITLDQLLRYGVREFVSALGDSSNLVTDLRLIGVSAERILVRNLRLLSESDSGDSWKSIPPPLIAEAYAVHFDNLDSDDIPVYRVSIKSHGISVTTMVVVGAGATLRDAEQVSLRLQDLRRRIVARGGSMDIARTHVSVCNTDLVLDLLKKNEREDALTMIRTFHAISVSDVYKEQKDLRKALMHMIRAYAIQPSIHNANNLAYLGMVNQKFDEALMLLESVDVVDIGAFDKALALYNRSICKLALLQVETARQFLACAKELAELVDPADRVCLCLLLPVWDESARAFYFDEQFDPDLLHTIAVAQQVLSDSVIY